MSGSIAEPAEMEARMLEPLAHAVVIAGAGPTGLMLAAEMALAGDVAIVERRPNQKLVGSRAGGLHARTIELLEQRGIAKRFISQGQVHKMVHFHIPLDVTDLPSRHSYVLGPWWGRRYLGASGNWPRSRRAVLIRPDGYAAWTGEPTERGLSDTLAKWFGPVGVLRSGARELSGASV
jgi:hypothetical protein